MTLLRHSTKNQELLHQLLEASEGERTQVTHELEEAGISLKRQNRWVKSHERFLKRKKRIKARASYSGTEKVMIVALAPLSLAFLEGGFAFEADKEYVTMRKQGAYYLSLGLSLWVLLFSIAYLPFALG